MTHVKRQYSKNLSCTKCNTGINHPKKTVGKRIAANTTPNQMSHALDTRDGQPGDPVNNSLRAWCFCKSKVFTKNSNNPGYCSKPDMSYKEELQSNENNIHLTVNDRSIDQAFSLL